MEDLKLRTEQMLCDFDEFERVFLQPYDPHSTDREGNTDTESAPGFRPQPESTVSWLERMEKSFVDSQLGETSFRLTGFKQTDCRCSNTGNGCDLYDKKCIVDLSPVDLNSTEFRPPISENLGRDSQLPNLVEDIPDTVMFVNKTDNSNNRNDSTEGNVYVPMSLDGVPLFDPSVLAIIDFDFPTSPRLEIGTTTYIDKADTEYGEEFAKKVAENLSILQEAMNRTSCCCTGAIRKDKGVCCKGKCWWHVERRWKQLQKITRGRKRKGSELSPEIRELCKERQKIKNRISAAKCYRKEKAHIHGLEVRVAELQAENKIRRNLVKFLEGSLQQQGMRSLGRTVS